MYAPLVASHFPRLSQHAWRRYAIALAAFLVSFFLRAELDAWLSPDRGFVLFLPAVILTTFFVGLATAALSGLALWYFFLPPYYSFQLDLEGIVRLATFVLASAVGIALVHWLRMTILRLEAERARAAQAEERIAAKLLGMTRLNQLGHILVRAGSTADECLSAIIDTAIVIMGADKGNVQLFDPKSDALTIAVQRGFEKPFLEFFAYVRDHASACSAAMRSAERVVVEDVTTSEIFAAQPSLKVLIDAGVRAVASTPLRSSSGNLLGMISIHFGKPHRPGERELLLMDLLALQAADYLERKRAEEIEKTLVREIQHRSNNLLAVIQAIAMRTLSGDPSLAQAGKDFQARLHALARTNQQLTKSNWMGMDLTEIVRLELEPFADHATVEGVNVLLGAQDAQNLSLALHELATNAVKHGALSNGSGKVRVHWTTTVESEENILKFRWQETGGPPVSAPTRRGFGTSLLKAMFADVRLDYPSDGLSCEFDIPFSRAGSGMTNIAGSAGTASAARP